MSRKLMGKKLGMTHIFDENGNVIPCTAILVEPNVVTQVKTREVDGYNAIQIACGKVKEKRVAKPQRERFKKLGTDARRFACEFLVEDSSLFSPGDELDLSVFEGIQFVDVSGVSKGKGFQGVMKLHGFKGGPAAHGSGFHRHAGSTGMRSTPGRCLPGGKRPSRMGGRKTTIQSLEIVELVLEDGVILVKGQVPGAKGALVYLQAAKKKQKGA